MNDMSPGGSAKEIWYPISPKKCGAYHYGKLIFPLLCSVPTKIFSVIAFEIHDTLGVAWCQKILDPFGYLKLN